MSSTRNPLRTFTRDQVVAKIKTETIYRRFYIQVVNKTWIQVPQDYILRYLAVPVRDEVEYTLDAIHERNVGYGLYIIPLDEDAEVVPEVSPVAVDKNLAIGQGYELGAEKFADRVRANTPKFQSPTPTSDLEEGIAPDDGVA